MKLRMAKADRQVRDAVRQELKSDIWVDETEIGVETENGVVTLTGTVSNYARKIAAEEAALRAEGVLDVADDIKVRPDGRMACCAAAGLVGRRRPPAVENRNAG